MYVVKFYFLQMGSSTQTFVHNTVGTFMPRNEKFLSFTRYSTKVRPTEDMWKRFHGLDQAFWKYTHCKSTTVQYRVQDWRRYKHCTACTFLHHSSQRTSPNTSTSTQPFPQRNSATCPSSVSISNVSGTWLYGASERRRASKITSWYSADDFIWVPSSNGDTGWHFNCRWTGRFVMCDRRSIAYIAHAYLKVTL